MRQTEKEIVASGQKGLEIADALNTTTVKILRILRKEELDVSTIAKRMDLSEAHISEQLRTLEDLGLIKVSYMRGKRGVRKLCKSSIEKIVIFLTDENATLSSDNQS
jgi:predicted transcriptional regulator